MLSFLALIQMDRRYINCIQMNVFFSLVVLAVFSGFRSNQVGADYLSYQEMFYAFNGLFSGGLEQVLLGEYFFEPGFAFLIVLISTFIDNHILFFLIISIVTSLTMGVAIRKISLFPLLSILIFFSYDYFTNYMVAIRFGLAASLGLFVVYFLSKGKKFHSFLLILLAMAMHTAAIGLFLPFALSFFKFRRIYIIIAIVISLVFGYINLGGFFVSNFLPSWVPRAESVGVYSGSQLYGQSLGYLGFLNIKYLLISVVLFLYWKELKSKVYAFYPLVLFLISAMAIRIGMHDLGFIVGRVAGLLGLVEIILIPSIALCLINQKIVGYALVLIYALVHLMFLLFVRGYGEYYSVFL